MLRILGIDPGLAQTGFGIIDIKNNRINHVKHGVVKTSSKDQISDRLHSIYDQLSEIITEYRPDEAGIEALYFAKNVLSAIPVAESKGVIHLLCSQNSIDNYEYTPLEIKQTIVGNGRADKRQVQELVMFLLKLDSLPKPDHCADALAAAICHYHNRNFRKCLTV